MKSKVEALWLDEVRQQAADTVNFLGNARKPERERQTCAAFLRCAGIPFTVDMVESSPVDPPDVCFGSARFEITMIPALNRRIHKEWKAIAKRRAEASRIEDLFDVYHPPHILSRQEVADLIIETSKKKTEKYSARGPLCTELDLLVYVNRKTELNVNSPDPVCGALLSHGWRSVSILMPPYSYVVLAADGAPGFLLEQIEEPRAVWSYSQLGLFDI